MGRWLRRNAWSLLTVLAVAGTLAAIIAVVRASAGRTDELRQAQIALAAAPGTLGSVHNSPLALIAGAPAGPSEFPLSRALRGALTTEMAGLNRFWNVPLARRLRREAAAVDARTAQPMALVAAHRLGGRTRSRIATFSRSSRAWATTSPPRAPTWSAKRRPRIKRRGSRRWASPASRDCCWSSRCSGWRRDGAGASAPRPRAGSGTSSGWPYGKARTV
jgi:hypothetical protein